MSLSDAIPMPREQIRSIVHDKILYTVERGLFFHFFSFFELNPYRYSKTKEF